MEGEGVVVALAGRRPDPIGAEYKRFPLENAGTVEANLRELFERWAVRLVVCSAAAGADLLALQAARNLGLRRRIVLPFPPERFRQTSVVDRPGPWGELYDPVITEAAETDDLVILRQTGVGTGAYARANEAILDEAEALARHPGDARAVIVWEGKPKEGDDLESEDLTAAFASSAERRGIPVEQVLTVRDLK